MLHIGCHLSASKGYYAMGKTALSIGADTFQFFTRNPRGSRAKPRNLNDTQKLNGGKPLCRAARPRAVYDQSLLRKRRHPHIRPRNDAG